MAHHVRQEILGMCDLVDRQFIFEVGPFGDFVVEEVREAWLASGNKVTTGHVIAYMNLLAEQISSEAKRQSFLEKAKSCLKL